MYIIILASIQFIFCFESLSYNIFIFRFLWFYSISFNLIWHFRFFGVNKVKQDVFVVHHSAKEVEYKITGFRVKNQGIGLFH